MPQLTKVFASGAAYLDPLHCGSLIGYEIHTRRRGRIIGNVTLTDCNRMITWYFSGGNGASTALSQSGSAESIAKLDKIVELFQKFREEFIKATKKRGTKCRK